jgi:hypothetical protein
MRMLPCTLSTSQELLVVRDSQRLYGEDWYFCYTQQAYDSELQRLQSSATSTTADAVSK